ncbi:MAG TPA: hypothetical protein VL485_05940 [Ktedonobacteraceae bacterium]|jgi:ribulose bisphosphate carboxylase small subunit|nr:hypothetical protein [Ktedonobacteraceae bacterium]
MPFQMQQLGLYYKRAFSWIDQHRDLFNPLQNEREENTANLYQTKALGELGLLCLLYQRYSVGDRESEIERSLQLIHTIWQHADYHERIVRRPEYFQLHTMIYVVLQQCAVIDDTYKAVIQQVLDQNYVIATETTPMRLLDRRHMLDCGTFHHSLPSYQELYKQTLLAHEPPAVYLTDTDVYAITHTLFYITDFGRSTTSVIAGDHLLAVHWLIEILLGVYLRRRNWDLVGELLLDCYCLHWYPDIIFTVAWECLLEAQFPNGSIPGPRFSVEQLAQMQDSQQVRYCFEQNYHTTIVNAITSFLIYQDLNGNTSENLKR